MRKILSVTLVVVMLAALVTVFPVSAAATAPALVITEVCPDTVSWTGSGSDNGDTYEFIEIYNPGTDPIDLYDYSIVISAEIKTADIGKTKPGDAKFYKINPIVQKGTSEYNTSGTVSTANYAENQYNLYPTNPETAILEPGKTAVIWVFGPEAIKAAVAKGSAITIDEFKEYFHMNNYSAASQEDILVVAVDGNGNAKDTTVTSVVTPTGTLEGTLNVAGVGDAAGDAFGISARFNLYNSQMRVYGIIANSTRDSNLKTTKLTDIKMSKCTSYAACNYNSNDVKKSLAYKTTSDSSYPATGSIANISYNFITTNKEVLLCKDGSLKTSGNVAYMGWLSYQYVTPGLLLPGQVDNFTLAKATDNDLNTTFTEPYTVVSGLTVGTSSVKGYYTKDANGIYSLIVDNDAVAATGVTYYANDLAYIRNVKTVDSYTDRVSYTAYLENFFGMADSTDSEAIIKALGWDRSTYLSNGGTARFSIVNGQLIADNLDIDANGNAILTDTGDIDSLDSIFTICPASIMANIALDDFTLEYELTYLDAQQNARYAMVVTNFDGRCSYDTCHIRVDGTANNQTRISGSSYVSYDNSKSVYCASNDDTTAEYTSLLNKITNGWEKVYTSVDTDIVKAEEKALLAPMIGKALKVRVEVSQVAGQSLYVNDILISKSNTNDDGESLSPYWGIKTNTDELALGLFVSQRVKVAIDNIKVYGYTEAYSKVKLEEQATANLVEPATGDATIYVAVAMAVSFISLAALVVVKRRKNEN